MNKGDRLTSLVWLGVAILICLGSLRLSLGNIRHPGPGFFSFMTGAILGLLSFILFSRSAKEGREEKKSLLARNPQGRLQMIWVLIALVVYAIGMNYVGFFFSTIIFLVALLRGIGRQGWGVSVATSSIGAIGFHFIFQYWLDVQMPRGIFGF